MAAAGTLHLLISPESADDRVPARHDPGATAWHDRLTYGRNHGCSRPRQRLRRRMGKADGYSLRYPVAGSICARKARMASSISGRVIAAPAGTLIPKP